MIQKGNRQQGAPYIIGKESSRKMERIPLNEKAFREDWLQELIFKNPQLLPIEDIESGFSPLISIGREINTAVGPIDNLFISPDGYITIVETKLWRNPEAKREVVGQILDYAKELTAWNYSLLDKEIRKRNTSAKGILDMIKENEFIDELDEKIVIDNIDRNLKRGRLLLLIVGDGVRESVEDMVEYLSNSAQLLFTLGLIEIQVYKSVENENDLIVIPNIITRTREITRAVIKIENNATDATVSVSTDFKEETSKNSKTRTSISEDDFFDQLENHLDDEMALFAKQIILDARDQGYLIDWKQASFSVKLTDPNGSGAKVTLFVVARNGGFYIGWAADQITKLGIDNDIAFEFARKTAGLFEGIESKGKDWNKPSSLSALKPKYTEFMAEVDRFVKEINSRSNAIAEQS